jgi:predicted O-methyltransferase YrrM
MEANIVNPYKNRNYPVGQLKYDLPIENQKVVDSISAQLEYGEKELLYDIPRIIHGGCIANLGCCFGGSATLLAKGLTDRFLSGRVYTVDIYKEKNQISKATDKFNKFNVFESINVCHGTTQEWGKRWLEDGTLFRFVFIDADHSYEGVRDDFLLFSKLITTNGWVAFHDTNQDYTNRVLEEYLLDNPRWTLKLWINRIKVFQKNGT